MAKDFLVKSNSLVVLLNGEIDQYVVTELKDRIDVEIEATARKNLIFDLSNVTLMDSSGIGLILGRYKVLKALGGSVAVSGASPSVKRIIDLSGISKIIPYYKNRDAADKSFDSAINAERSENK